MAQQGSVAKGFVRALAEQLRVHARVILTLAAAVAIGVVLLVFLTALYAVVLGQTA